MQNKRKTEHVQRSMQLTTHKETQSCTGTQDGDQRLEMLTPQKPTTTYSQTWNSNIWTETHASPSLQHNTGTDKHEHGEHTRNSSIKNTALHKMETIRMSTSSVHAALSNVENTTAGHTQQKHTILHHTTA